jgi:L-seryl-tRNA(Ser) seleniumtransferase
MQEDAGHLYRKLPQVGQLLDRPEFVALQLDYPRRLIAETIRSVLDGLRRNVRAGRHTEFSLDTELEELRTRVEQSLSSATRTSLRRVINATGVILQTNLGRAPLSEAAIHHIAEVARCYCNLELDLETGKRSYRDQHVEQLILNALAMRSQPGKGAFMDKAAAVVNNCAAACFLALNTIAEGGEVIVSRGELIEIGGGFRVPDILRKSGAVLHEVGTTNRTRLSDYAAAINPQTRLILRVHRSNFRIEGFTERPTLEELRDLGARESVPVFEDQGTGCVLDLETVGIPGESSPYESSLIHSVASDIALVASSGDKLLGGPQCGILVGSKPYIERIRSNPLFRAVRVDKLTYAALEVTLLAYLSGREESIPAVAMMRASSDGIRDRCLLMAEAVRTGKASVEVVETQSIIGGGTTPGASLASFAVAVRHASVSESLFGAHLRSLNPAVMARSHEGRVLLDLRTVAPRGDAMLTELLQEAIESVAPSGELEEQL